jgi:broad specificity phosphatase PhoE
LQLILIRHGETLWNKEGRVQGVSDVELSDVGRMQARSLALNLHDHPIRAIHASPLKRACQTAEIINEFHHLDIRIQPDLMEMNQGDFEGLPFPELMVREKVFLKKWITDPAAVKMPNGESLFELQQRAWRAVEQIISGSENALIVSHNFTIAAILCRLRNISLSEFRKTCVDTASKTIVRFQNGEASIELLNDCSYLKNT